MPTRIIDRKTFLSASVAGCASVALGGCAGESQTTGVDDTGGTDSGGTASGGAASGGTATGGTTGGIATGGTATGGTTGGTATGGRATGGTATGGRATGGTATGGTATGGRATGGTATGGTSGSGGGSYVCTTVTDNGNHAHPLTIPSSDVQRGYQVALYVLEDGGTGHIHTLALSPYEFLYLSAGVEILAESNIAQGHTHPCRITCAAT